MTMPEGGQVEGADDTLSADAGVGPVSAGQDGQTGDSGPIGSDGVQATPEEIKLNEAWNPILQVVPEQFHPEMKRTLKEWDRNYGSLAEKYAPYKKSFADRGVTAEDLQSAYHLYSMVNTNPQEVFRRMAAVFAEQGTNLTSLLPEKFQNLNQNPDEDEDIEEDEESQLQKLQQQLEQQQQQFQQYYGQQQYQQQVSQIEQQLDAEIKQIMASDPNVDVPDMLNRYSAMVSSYNGQGEQPSLQAAYQAQQAFVAKVQQRFGNSGQTKNAPRIIPGGSGGAPSDNPGNSVKTQEARIQRAAALINAAKQSG